jgi:hypothetical protein
VTATCLQVEGDDLRLRRLCQELRKKRYRTIGTTNIEHPVLLP